MLNKVAKIKLDLAERLAPTISTRVAIQALRNELVASPATSIVLDFKNVESVSRSAAHETVMMISDLTNLFQKTIKIENTNNAVKAMLATVTDQSIKSKPEERHVSHKTVDFEELCQPA